jgi:threonylcarbamoyladenosine tRNA methylthiotransferase MtaB
MKKSTSKTFVIETLGCKVNQFESEGARELLLRHGYSEAAEGQSADVAIVNTCVVTAQSEAKCRKLIRQMRRQYPHARLVVLGCMTELAPDFLKQMPEVDLVIPKKHEQKIIELLEESIPSVPPSEARGFFSVSKFSGHERAFLMIEDGCENFCSYCIVPHLRGPVRSRPLEEIKTDAQRLAQNGYKEIVLTGIHLGAYGRDFAGKIGVADVLESLLETKVQRLRLSSIEINEITPKLLDLMKKHPDRLCPHLHIPLQSGDNRILKLMKRRYNTEQFLARIAEIRAHLGEVAITTDLILGFPGETEREFENSLETCRSAEFSRMHVFPFSPRQGTPAAEFSGRVPPEEMKRRVKETDQLARRQRVEFAKKFLHRPLVVLVESKPYAPGILQGYSAHYVETVFPGETSLSNTIVNVTAKKLSGWKLHCEVVT